MQTTLSHGIVWWTGSNGNLFGDHDGFRYCIAKLDDGYLVSRNGVVLGKAPSMADAKLFVARQ